MTFGIGVHEPWALAMFFAFILLLVNYRRA
jgi:hypothetical protein